MPTIRIGQRAATEVDPRLGPETVLEALAPFLSPRRQRRIARVVEQRLLSVTVLLEHPYDPHNAAAVLRTCEGLGLLTAHVVPGEAGFRLSARVTQAADKWIDVYLHADTRAALGYLRSAGYRLLAATPPPLGETPNRAALAGDASQPVALVFGNEHAGLTREGLEACDGRFHLPMFGFTESYNLSVSAALALASLVDARRAVLGAGGDLSRAAKLRLRAAYYARSVPRAAGLVQRHLAARDPR